jgi:hypothetical protein
VASVNISHPVPAQPGWYALVAWHECAVCERWPVVAWLGSKYSDALVIPPTSPDGAGLPEFASEIEAPYRCLVGIFHDEYQPQDDEVVRELIESRERLAAQEAEASSSTTTNQEALTC